MNNFSTRNLTKKKEKTEMINRFPQVYGNNILCDEIKPHISDDCDLQNARSCILGDSIEINRMGRYSVEN